MKNEGDNAQNKGFAGKNRTARAGTDCRWIIRTIVWTVFISIALTLFASNTLKNVGYVLAFAVLAAFILLGIAFDVIGVAATAADERPFHSMAAHKVHGAYEAIRLVRNSEKVSNFCNDVIGDISGIISGTTSAVIVSRLAGNFSADTVIMQLVFTGVVSGLTVGGKAVGKSYAINNSTGIVLFAAKAVYWINVFKLRLFPPVK